MTSASSVASQRWRLKLSIPREHGTWFMVYGPMVMALALGSGFHLLDTILLVVATTGAFFAQDAIRPVLRRRRDASLSWFAITAATAAAAGIALAWQRPSILYVAGLGAALASPLLFMLTRKGRKRFERSQLGQLVAMPLLTLSALAGYVVAHGELTAQAWWLWAMCAAYFGSGVFVVHLLFEAAKRKEPMDRASRLVLGRALLLYHGALSVAVCAGAAVLADSSGLWIAAGFAPVVARALLVLATVTTKLPNLIKIGLLESVYTIWFMVCVIIAMR